ncbi:microneme associated antigen, putative [Plasmodium berghei]|uniref:Microneme associated antigen, putative n=2 Tax=Plasmodium berghei TaxID=5821 RepID=A0A509AF76_PLABA|nr:microneme associated antigen, putative [Plasmodium berghei ANKA]CXI03492.1 microneme associated antigen, putative [Plasmodium berghei]SCL92117.1 microneme associated antigen, putative [Plasmodium berghei]SCM15598.1 microneme associated antigen, putative [Plasmodium berghei]SCM17390.1 microneme associated antigen, putative [Plasmodium berghei]SCN22652.1 microneme associated antigen, putative [Plasmodium berghei]|eukprot:XP_034420196.1 microneme associated antigen, putative [Plasmodium berghei ANKA]
MQEQRFNGKFSILNGNLFTNLCRINGNKSKGKESNDVELKEEMCLKNRDNKNREMEEIGSNIISYDNSEKMKKNFNSQLIYSYYNNFAANKYIEYEPDQKNMKNMYTYRQNRNDNEYNKNKSFGSTESNNNCSMKFNNNIINKTSNYKHLGNNNENETLFFKEDNVICNEFKKLKHDILELQIMNVNLQKQILTNHVINNSNTIPQHIIINNKTEVASNTLSQLQNNNNNNNNKKKNGLIYFLLKKILSSKINQMLIVSSFFISIYIAHKHWQRALKIAELQSKVNSNFILKSVKTIEEMVGIRSR